MPNVRCTRRHAIFTTPAHTIFVHEESAEVLKTLYKPAFFALQAKHYLETGAYIAKRKDLANKLQGEDLKILTCPAQFKTKISLRNSGLFRAAFKLGCGCYKNYGGGSKCRNRKLK
mgnify:CR=1 FL=1